MKPSLRVAAKSAFSLVDLLLGSFPGPRILIYHQIGAGNGKQMDLEPEHFRHHLDHLDAAGYRVVGLDEAIAAAGESDADRNVVLTFDDGYADMYRNAFPLLRDRRLPFTVYLTSNPIESGQPLADDGKSSPIGWDAVTDMLDSGLMTVGAHTHTHPDFRTISPAGAEHEIETSTDLIERRTGIRPEHFAYPWGYWSEQSDPVIRQTYRTATLGGGPPVTAERDHFLLNRIPVQLHDGVRFFRYKLRRGQRTEEFVRRRLARYSGP